MQHVCVIHSPVRFLSSLKIQPQSAKNDSVEPVDFIMLFLITYDAKFNNQRLSLSQLQLEQRQKDSTERTLLFCTVQKELYSGLVNDDVVKQVNTLL